MKKMFLKLGKPQPLPRTVYTPMWIHLHLLQSSSKDCVLKGMMNSREQIQDFLRECYKNLKKPKWGPDQGVVPSLSFGSNSVTREAGPAPNCTPLRNQIAQTGKNISLITAKSLWLKLVLGRESSSA
ncbi:hypothetical protein GWK47_019620 [Chionoecetes opilio]|uniref:Uncharacterized protein n=1 Tax=Chionoecetes opilio TaxID=41210 RepID=A0A8J4XQ58_CHIOP|nr:hypothetical protein GWK47_019620 [Chionoecetes opilio]